MLLLRVATIYTKHVPLDCPLKSLEVNMLKVEDYKHFKDDGNNICLKYIKSNCCHNCQDMMNCAKTKYQNSTSVNLTTFKL